LLTTELTHRTRFALSAVAGRLVVGLVAFTLIAGQGSAAADDFTWTGDAAPGTAWSSSSNWAGGTSPSGGVGRITFPQLTASACTASPPTGTCYQSASDVPGITANALSIDGPYFISGDSINLGSGGLTATLTTATAVNLGMPLVLTAPQIWSITGGGGVDVSGGISGTSEPLTLDPVGNGSLLALNTHDVEVGSFAADGANTSYTGAAAFLNGQVVSVDSLNGSDGNTVSLIDAGLRAGGSLGPLHSSGGGVVVGKYIPSDPTPGTLAVNGDIGLDSGTALQLTLTQAGTVPGTDYGQLTATQDVNLGGASLYLVLGGACPDLAVGDVATLVSSQGTITGTFGGVPDGSTVTTRSSAGCSKQFSLRIDYTSHTVTATVVAIQQTLHVNKAGTGSGLVTSSPSGINCGSSCSAAFPPGADVTLRATPDRVSHFAGWSGGGCSGIGSCQVTMSSARTVSARFIKGAEISSVTPGWGPFTGRTVTITGSGFGSDPTVGVFDPTCGVLCARSAQVVSATATTIRATVPRVTINQVGVDDGPVSVVVETANGSTAVAQRAFTYVVPEVGLLVANNGGSFDKCTAAAVRSENHSVVLTAGHCVDSGATDIAFAPGYYGADVGSCGSRSQGSSSVFRCGTTPYGVWCAKSRAAADPGCGTTSGAVRLDSNFGRDPHKWDFAYIAFAPKGGIALGGRLGGGLAITFGVGAHADQRWNLYAYDPQTNYLDTCNAPAAYDYGGDGAAVLQIADGGDRACSFVISGASGGPWINGRNGETYGIGAVNDTSPTPNPEGQVTGTYMGHDARILYNAVQDFRNF
jgi:hypothetical protein